MFDQKKNYFFLFTFLMIFVFIDGMDGFCEPRSPVIWSVNNGRPVDQKVSQDFIILSALPTKNFECLKAENARYASLVWEVYGSEESGYYYESEERSHLIIRKQNNSFFITVSCDRPDIEVPSGMNLLCKELKTKNVPCSTLYIPIKNKHIVPTKTNLFFEQLKRVESDYNQRKSFLFHGFIRNEQSKHFLKIPKELYDLISKYFESIAISISTLPEIHVCPFIIDRMPTKIFDKKKVYGFEKKSVRKVFL
jgi:hypothetical protein